MVTQSKLNPENQSRFYFLMRQLPVRILRYLRKQFKTLILCWSGGTDSTLLLLIAKDYGVFLDRIMFNDTKLEHVDTKAYIKQVSQSLKLTLDIVKPNLSASQISAMIIEDFDKFGTGCQPYDKSDYRCCYYAKEIPVKEFLISQGLDTEKTCLLRGIRGADNSIRLMTTMKSIEFGHFYYWNWKHAKQAKVAQPLQLVSDEQKESQLHVLCERFHIPLPQKSGCSICPIFFKFADAQERKQPRWKLAERFFSKRAKSVLDAYLYRNQKLESKVNL